MAYEQRHCGLFSSFMPTQEQEQLSYSSTRTKTPSVVVTGLRPSTVYVFHVRARTAAGYTAYGSSFEFTTAAEGMHALMHVFLLVEV